jgi:diguanylate cyclase (GGDEF)-like protein
MSNTARENSSVFTLEAYQEFFNDLPIAYAVFDVKTDENQKVLDVICLYASPLMSAFMNRSVEEMVGISLLEDKPMGRHWLKELKNAAYHHKRIRTIEYLPQSKKWVCVNVGPSGTVGRCVITMEDVTTEHENALNLSVLSKTDELIISCAKCLNSGMSHEETIHSFLQIIGEAIHCDRLYILEDEGNAVFSLTFGWGKRNQNNSAKEFQHMTREDMLNWEEEFPGEYALEINNVENIRQTHPTFYRRLQEMDIHSMYEVQLRDDGTLIGYFGAIGYGNVSSVDAKMLLETVAYFLTSEISHRKLLRELELKSTHDILCGVNNRNALEDAVHHLLQQQRPVGVLYADANGLKVINDTKGHKAGDTLLRNLSGILVDAFGLDKIYRAGGDEFVAMVPDMARETFISLCEQLRETFEARKDMAVALGWAWTKNSAMVMETLHIADKAMYRDKADYYKHNDRRKRDV